MWQNIWVWCKANWWIKALLIAIFLASSYFFLIQPMFYTHDYVHGARIAEMARGLQEGQLPVIWSQNFGFGYGMPLFEFYAPLPYFIGALFHLIGFSLADATKLLFLLANLLTICGAYFLGRQFFGAKGGLVVAAATAMAPYRATDIFVRGALSETMAIAFLPWLFWGAARIILTDQYKKSGLIFIFGLVGLILSHNLTAMLTVPALALWILLISFYQFGFKWRQILSKWLVIFSNGVLALALSCFYWLPALIEKDLTQADYHLLSYYFNYQFHMLYFRQFFNPVFSWYGGSGWGPNDNLSFFLGWGQLAAALVSGALVAWWLLVKRKLLSKIRLKKILLLIGSAAILFFTLWMTTYKSSFLWEKIDFLKYTQFPWRYLAVSIILLGFLTGGIVSWTKKTATQTILSTAVVLFIISSNVYIFRADLNIIPGNTDTALYYGDPQKIRNHMSTILADYIPISGAYAWEGLSTETLFMPPAPPITAEWPEVTIVLERAHEKLVKTNFNQETALEWAVTYYPGWRAQLDGQELEITTGQTGGIVTVVPAGQHSLSLKLGPTPIRALANTISVLGSLVLLYIWVIRKNARRQ